MESLMQRPIRTLFLSLLVVTVLADCARLKDSKLNPFNWFKRSEQVEQTLIPPEALAARFDYRDVVDQVLSMSVEQTPGGAILRATGLPPVQGYFDGELVLQPVTEETQGVLVYQFKVHAPYTTTRVSTERSRIVVVALNLTAQKLEGVREIRVEGIRNARSVRR
jgi:hypothetical protein